MNVPRSVQISNRHCYRYFRTVVHNTQRTILPTRYFFSQFGRNVGIKAVRSNNYYTTCKLNTGFLENREKLFGFHIGRIDSCGQFVTISHGVAMAKNRKTTRVQTS